jgi:hypothetical protein
LKVKAVETLSGLHGFFVCINEKAVKKLTAFLRETQIMDA